MLAALAPEAVEERSKRRFKRSLYESMVTFSCKTLLGSV